MEKGRGRKRQRRRARRSKPWPAATVGSAVSAIHLAPPLAWTGLLVATQSEAALSLLLNPFSLHKCFLSPYDKPGTSFDSEESGGAEADMSRGPVKPAGWRERQTFYQEPYKQTLSRTWGSGPRRTRRKARGFLM